MATTELSNWTTGKIAEAAFDGAHVLLQERAVALFDLGRTRQNGNFPLYGSGTLIRVGPRVFVATAHHVLMPMTGPATRRIWVARARETHEDDGFPGFIKKGKHSSSEEVDVAYLEIDEETAAEYFPKQRFCELDDIADFGPGREGAPTAVYGCPEGIGCISSQKGATRSLIFNVARVYTLPFASHEWPTVNPDFRQPDPKIDVFIQYDQSQDGWEMNGMPATLPNAKGMSGGGIWDLNFVKGQLWSGQNPKLFAIQSSWDPERGYLRAVQIRLWIDMIYRDYPDLQPLIDAWRAKQGKVTP